MFHDEAYNNTIMGTAKSYEEDAMRASLPLYMVYSPERSV